MSFFKQLRNFFTPLKKSKIEPKSHETPKKTNVLKGNNEIPDKVNWAPPGLGSKKMYLVDEPIKSKTLSGNRAVNDKSKVNNSNRQESDDSFVPIGILLLDQEAPGDTCKISPHTQTNSSHEVDNTKHSSWSSSFSYDSGGSSSDGGSSGDSGSCGSSD